MKTTRAPVAVAVVAANTRRSIKRRMCTMAVAYAFGSRSGACIQFLIDVLVLQDFRSWPLHGFAINDGGARRELRDRGRAPATQEKTPAVSRGCGGDAARRSASFRVRLNRIQNVTRCNVRMSCSSCRSSVKYARCRYNIFFLLLTKIIIRVFKKKKLKESYGNSLK